MTGTGLAQAIPIAATPILTRLYAPDQYGLFALYVASSSILAVLVTGRYELAIVLPEDDDKAINVAALSIGLSVVVSLVLLVLFAIAGDQIAMIVGYPSISQFLYFVPLATMLIGFYQSLNYWSNRRKHYRKMAVSRVAQTSSTTSVQLMASMLGPLGLILGQIAGQGISILYLLRSIVMEERGKLNKISSEMIARQARLYHRFPKFLVMAHLFNVVASQSPVILLTALFSSSVSGVYMLTERVLSAPIGLVASAIGDVFRQEASYTFSKTGQCKALYLSTLRKLVLVSFLPFVVLFFSAEYIFGLVFGNDWVVAGEYAKYLAPMFFLRFVASPLSAMYIIAEAQAIDLMWQAVLVVVTVLSLYVGSTYDNVGVALKAFSISYCVMYIFNLVISYRLAAGGVNAKYSA